MLSTNAIVTYFSYFCQYCYNGGILILSMLSNYTWENVLHQQPMQAGDVPTISNTLAFFSLNAIIVLLFIISIFVSIRIFNTAVNVLFWATSWLQYAAAITLLVPLFVLTLSLAIGGLLEYFDIHQEILIEAADHIFASKSDQILYGTGKGNLQICAKKCH